MPVSNTFKAYPLLPTLWHTEDGPIIWTKGHHDPATFLAAAVLEWAQEDDDSLNIYEGGGWERAEGPVWPPRHLRATPYVDHEWWATRMSPWLEEMGARYFVEPVPCWRRGAYPVTKVEL